MDNLKRGLELVNVDKKDHGTCIEHVTLDEK